MAPPPPPPQPPIPPPSAYPVFRSRPPPDVALIGAFLVIVLIAIFAIFLFGATGAPGPMFSAAPFFCIPFLFVIVFLVIAFAQRTTRRTIPPPPPIQQPMVPAGQHGPVALNCPNCGGPPTNVDRFGIATCSYCGTRFLVR